MPASAALLEEFRLLLCGLGDAIRCQLAAARRSDVSLAGVAAQTTADTIYEIDKVSEAAITTWFAQHWPVSQPVQIVMEGIEDDQALCFPAGIPVEKTLWKCLIDPIDGTRGIMYDKRSAWSLAGLAPQAGAATRLSHIAVAAMTEIPTSKQWRADQLSAVRGAGVIASSTNVLDGAKSALFLRPSAATDFRHGFSSMAKYFPEGRALTAAFEERLWEEMSAAIGQSQKPVFDDQYICTGGVFYELMAGHDRMVGDLRPLIFARLGILSELTCHPYDVAAALLLEEAGIVYEHPLGGFPDASLDTTTPIAWIAYANSALAADARPIVQRLLREMTATPSS